ncbi:hypothetical protein [Streptomyces sp. NPDC055749]
MRWVLLRRLAPPVLRATRLLPSLTGAALGGAIVAAPVVAGVELEAHYVVLLLRCSMVITVIGVAFVLDDPTARTTEVLPVHRAWISSLRCLTALAALGAAWAVQVAIAPLAVPTAARSALPLASLTLEPLTLAVWALALAALGTRLTAEGSGGILAAPGLILSVIAAMLLPEKAALFAQPQSEGWDQSRWIWGAVLGAAALGLCLLLRESRSTLRLWPAGRGRTNEQRPTAFAESS